MDRGRDRRYDGRGPGYGGSESYRPGGRPDRSPPPHNNTFRPRSPPRRPRSPPMSDRAFPPRGARFDERQRSRSPARRSPGPPVRGRDGGMGYHERARSPPRNEGRPRSPLPQRRFSRSPLGGPSRARSPGPRGRDFVPASNFRGQRSPPPPQGRYNEPRRDDYDRRDYVRPREDAPRYTEDNAYRSGPRSRSPPRISAQASKGPTPVSSRRASPKIHPDRMRPDLRSPRHSVSHPDPSARRSPPPYRGRERSPPRRAPSPLPVRSPPRANTGYRTRSPVREASNYRARSPAPRQMPEHRNRSPIRDTSERFERAPAPRGRSPPPIDRSPPSAPREREENYDREEREAAYGPHGGRGGPEYRNGEARGAIPSGPSSSRYGRETAPAGPPSAPISMSAHSRPGGAAMEVPTRPRDAPRGPFRDNGYEGYREGAPAARGFGRGGRGGYYGGPPSYRGGRHFEGPPAHHASHDEYGAPSGPRGGYAAEARPAFDSVAGFKPNNSSSTTYPRTQRFNNHLDDLPKVVEGGKKAAGGPTTMEAGTASRLAALKAEQKKLQAEQKKLQEQIEEKQRAMRQRLREWERAEQETANATLRSELAEAHLEALSGEAGSAAGAAY